MTYDHLLKTISEKKITLTKICKFGKQSIIACN